MFLNQSGCKGDCGATLPCTSKSCVQVDTWHVVLRIIELVASCRDEQIKSYHFYVIGLPNVSSVNKNLN